MKPKTKQPVVTIEQQLQNAKQEIARLQQKLDWPMVRVAVSLSERLSSLEDDLAEERRIRQELEHDIEDLRADARNKNSDQF